MVYKLLISCEQLQEELLILNLDIYNNEKQKKLYVL